MIASLLKLFGVDIRKTYLAIRGLPYYVVNYFKFKKNNPVNFPVTKLYPCLTDRFEPAGSVDNQYFIQDLYVAQQVYANKPDKHVDIGSRIDGFVAHVATFTNVEVFDIRPLELSNLNNISFKQMDILNIPNDYTGYARSLSCLHALEHFGLGRYGDSVDPDGYIKAFKNLVRILSDDGVLYFSVPIGRQRVEFDAHRVFSIETLLQLFTKYNLNIKEFSYIDDNCQLHTNIDYREGIDNDFKCNYCCGIFTLSKIHVP